MAPLEQTGETKKRGTKITFMPDEEIFETTEFSFDILSQRLRELAFLNAGVRIKINDERADNKSHEFYYEGGINSFVEYLNRNKTALHPKPIYLQGRQGRASRSRSPCSTTTATTRRSSPSPTTSTPTRAAPT